MFKKLLIATLIGLIPTVVFTACDKEENEVVVPNAPDDDSNDGDNKPDKPDDGTNANKEKSVIIHADGTASDGSHFRPIDGTTFMLNYIKYQIREGHIEVIGHDNTEIGLTLNGKVDLYSKIEFNNISYNIRKM